MDLPWRLVTGADVAAPVRGTDGAGAGAMRSWSSALEAAWPRSLHTSRHSERLGATGSLLKFFNVCF